MLVGQEGGLFAGNEDVPENGAYFGLSSSLVHATASRVNAG